MTHQTVTTRCVCDWDLSLTNAVNFESITIAAFHSVDVWNWIFLFTQIKMGWLIGREMTHWNSFKQLNWSKLGIGRGGSGALIERNGSVKFDWEDVKSNQVIVSTIRVQMIEDWFMRLPGFGIHWWTPSNRWEWKWPNEMEEERRNDKDRDYRVKRWESGQVSTFSFFCNFLIFFF